MAETHANDKTPATDDHDSSCQRELVINLTHRSARELLEMNAGVEERRPRETKLKPTSTKRQHAVIQHDQSEAQSQAKLSMYTTRPVTIDGIPWLTNLEFQSDRRVLKAIGVDTLAAFESESGGLEKLPAGKCKDKMESLSGKGRRPADISHLPQNAKLVFEITSRKGIGAAPSDDLLIISIDPSSLCMKADYDAKPGCFKGILDPAVTIEGRDIHDIAGGRVILGPPYPWNQQLICDIPPDRWEELHDKQPLNRLDDDGTRVGEVLCVGHRDVSSSGKPKEGRFVIQDRPLDCVSGFTQASKQLQCEEEVALAGSGGRKFPVRTRMVVSFQPLGDAVTGLENPSLKACHGIVVSIGQSEKGEVEATLRLLLGKGNFPAHFAWSRLPHDGVFQTNLQVTIPMSWITNSYRANPSALHPMPGFRPEDQFKIGNPSRPNEGDVFICGQLDFLPGEIVEHGVAKRTANLPDAWIDRCTNKKFKALAQRNDWCARGGPVTDKRFKQHADWKKRFCDYIRGNHLPHFRPKAQLNRVAALNPKDALSTLSQGLRLTACPAFQPLLYDLHIELLRFALNKAKRAKGSAAGSACSFNTSIRGDILLQMVHEYVPDYAVHLKEGVVEAVVDTFAKAEKLLGSVDGEFNCEGYGIMQFFPEITFRFLLYSPTTRPEDPRHLSSSGQGQVEFAGFVAKDRHGGHLKGTALNDTGDGGSGGAPPGNYPCCTSHPIDIHSVARRHWW